MNFRDCAIYLIIVWALAGCEEREVAPVSDSAALQRFVSESRAGRELFGNHVIVDTAAYRVPYSSGTCRDSLLGQTRTITVLAPKDRYDFEGGQYRQAMVTVKDEYSIQKTLRFGTSAVVDTNLQKITRHGFFIKYGDDSRDYLGWVLRGMRSDSGSPSPVNLMYVNADGDTLFLNNQAKVYGLSEFGDFTDLSDLTQIPKDNPLFFVAADIPTNDTVGFYSRLIHEEDNKVSGTNLFRISEPSETDSVNLSENTSRYWHIVVTHTYRKRDGTPAGSSVLPYRIQY